MERLCISRELKFLTFFLTLGIILIKEESFAAAEVVRGDSSQLSPIDISKVFDVKSFGGDRLEFKTKNFESKNIDLPVYSGDLKSLPMTDWRSSKPDFYSKAISLRDFEIKKTAEKWSRQMENQEKTDLFQKASHIDEKQSHLPDRPIEIKQLESPKMIHEKELEILMNRGAEMVPLQQKGGAGLSLPHSKEPPEMKSPPKLEPSK